METEVDVHKKNFELLASKLPELLSKSSPSASHAATLQKDEEIKNVDDSPGYVMKDVKMEPQIISSILEGTE